MQDKKIRFVVTMIRKIKWVTILGILAAVFCGYFFSKNKNVAVKVETARVKLSVINSLVYAVGQVQATREFQIKAKTSGIIEQSLIREGVNVNQGQELLILSAETGLISIKSPINGKAVYIPKRIVKGEFVGAGDQLLTVTDLNDLRIEAYINEVDMGSIHLGQKAVVKSDAFINQEFEGSVFYIASEVREIDGVGKVPVHIRLFSQKKLVPGNKVFVKIVTTENKKVKNVPIQAIVEAEDSKKYLILNRRGAALLQEIKTGISDTDNIEIISNSIQKDDLVILDHAISQGTFVKSIE